MTLWIILTAMCSAAAVLVTIPLIRRYEHGLGQPSADTGIYQDQLKEIERDRSLGQIGESEADLAKIEIQRRLLASVKTFEPARPVSPAWRAVALAATAGLVVLGSANLYGVTGRPDLPAAQPSPATTASDVSTAVDPAKTGAGDVDAMITKLAAKMKGNPQDAEGWRMLGWSYFNTQRFDEAASAYGKAIAIAPGNLGFQSAYAEALVQAAGGIVTPKALERFDVVLKADPKEERSRFYAALAREQAGDVSPALDMWIALFNDAPKDAGWLVDVRQRIADLGARTGRDVTAVLANAPVIEPAGTGSLAASDQNAAVDQMIGSLKAKLEANPADRDGWAMMIRSLKVKGDVPGAESALARALDVFKNDPSTRDQIAALAKTLGVGTGRAPISAPVVSQDDISAASAMPAEDQQAMIRGMVDRLSEKLAASPHDAEGWMRLIRSRMVLNEPEQARAALAKAMAEFASEPVARSEIVTAARSMGVKLD